MVERGAGSWFYSCESEAQREKKKRRRQLAEIPGTYKEKILREFNVSGVLSPLVYEGVFSLTEYHEVMSRGCYGKRVESFLGKLCCKGPKAFCAFCSHLEEFCPYLLTCFFLYYQVGIAKSPATCNLREEAGRQGSAGELLVRTVTTVYIVTQSKHTGPYEMCPLQKEKRELALSPNVVVPLGLEVKIKNEIFCYLPTILEEMVSLKNYFLHPPLISLNEDNCVPTPPINFKVFVFPGCIYWKKYVNYNCSE